MYKIKYIGYDLYELNPDLGSGKLLFSMCDIRGYKKMRFKSIGGALKFCSKILNTQYHKYDWNFEEDLGDKGNDGYVLHIIVDKEYKWANKKMIDKFRDGKIDLYDYLANVFLEKV